MPGEKIFTALREKQVQFQDRALTQFLTSKVYPFSPYYRRLFDQHKINPAKIKSVADLQNIPFTTKADLIRTTAGEKGILDFILQPNEENLKRDLPSAQLLHLALKKIFLGKAGLKTALEKEYRPIFITATTGTTQTPVSFAYTAPDLERLKLYGSRMIDILGAQSSDKAVNLFPYAPHLAFWQAVFAGLAAGAFIFSTGGGKTFGTDANIRAILKIKPDLLIGTPDYVYHILREARLKESKIPFLKKVVLGASRVPKGFKIKLSQLLTAMGAPDLQVLGTYGFTEARGSWVECPTGIEASSGYHIYPDMEIFEVIDPETGAVRGEGEDGELVYTPLDAHGSCVIRYRTGDFVRGGITYGPCPYCKRTLPRISSDIVRASNIKTLQLTKIKGALINLNTLEYLLDDDHRIENWQIEVVKKDNDPFEVDEIHLYLNLDEHANTDHFAEQINEKVSACTEISFNRIIFETRAEIKHRLEIESAVKAKKIIDSRPAQP